MQRVVLRNFQKRSMLMGSANRVMVQRYFSTAQFGVDKANIPTKATFVNAENSVSSVTSVDAD